MAVYDQLASHYDAVTGDSSAEATLVDSLITKANRKAATLLEVGCGTGSIITALAGRYQVSGLDVSPGMLAVARQKLPPGTPLYEADMTCFELTATFDAVICVYHGINHVLDFSGWERFFDRVHKHLNDGGVFAFDVYSASNLKMMARIPKEVQQFGDNYLVIKVRTNDEIVYEWNIEVYECQPGGDYRLLSEVVRTVTFPIQRIQRALGEKFTDVRAVDGDGNPVTDEGEDRTWFVCTRR